MGKMQVALKLLLLHPKMELTEKLESKSSIWKYPKLQRLTRQSVGTRGKGRLGQSHTLLHQRQEVMQCLPEQAESLLRRILSLW